MYAHGRTLTFFPVSATLAYISDGLVRATRGAGLLFPVQDLPSSTRGYLSLRTSRVYIILPHLPRRFGSYFATTSVARKTNLHVACGEWHVTIPGAASLSLFASFILSSAISRGHGRKQYLHATAHPRPLTHTHETERRSLRSGRVFSSLFDTS